MKKIILISFIIILFSGCKSLPNEGEKEREVSRENIKDYVGKELNHLNDDFNVESCELKIAYFKDVYAVKFSLKDEEEIIVILKKKIELSKTEMEQGCFNEKIYSSIIAKIRFYKNGTETILDNISNK